MTQEEIQMVAKLVAAEVKKTNPCCPLHGLTQEQANAIVHMADGLIVSKKTFWEVTRKVISYMIWGLLGWGIIAVIAEAYSKFPTK